ncbi:hypothetical protein MLD38_008765 [Melastoma candidum]|uniref:Uncharacterized protein n=1 Tax=Melastoma candidum TaxID=119954 RepID=A0ACB9RV32_9MYRT|nr:hypothetical protein MLD38_008765 [Melastoma candidum]
MMNQREKLFPPGTSPLEDRHVLEVRHDQSTSYPYSGTPSEGSSWPNYGVDNSHTQNGYPSNSTYGYEHHVLPSHKDSVNGATEASSLSLGSTSIGQDYNGYMTYQNSTDSSGYGNTGYTGYYSVYQQQPQNSYAQPVASYQSTSAPYHPPASYQNTGSCASSSSYSNTYYNPPIYQSPAGYSSSNYSNQTSQWNGATYSSYTQYPYSNYPPASTSAYSSSNASLSSAQYQPQYNQWAEHYAHAEVSCAPGTEKLSVTASSQVESVNSGITHGTTTTVSSQPTPPIAATWRPDTGSLEVPPPQPSGTVVVGYDAYWKHTASGYHNHHTPSGQSNYLQSSDAKAAYSNYPEEQKSAYNQSNLQYPQVPQSHQMSEQINTSATIQSVSRVQIPTNPRIVSNLALGLTKTEKAAPEAKPAYISVSYPKTNEKTSVGDATNSTLKPGVFPKSLRGYVERALARCKGDAQIAASQAVMKEIITNATTDGTLHTRDWDAEPLFPLPDVNNLSKESQTPTSFLLFKKSPTRRTKSRWEPVAEEKSAGVSTPKNNNAIRYGGWKQVTARDQKALVDSSEEKEDMVQAPSISNVEHKFANIQKRFKKPRLSVNVTATENGDASSDSDKDVNLTAEERKKRESRSKRFGKGRGNHAEKGHVKPKVAGLANLYTRRATAQVLSKPLDDSGSRAVEDIDWDSLTVRGTCQEIEKRYLRLTSAPDPATVRPEEVLEKALLMVQNSQKNYLYKCDQLKSIRQDLTVQRIRNHLTVKVYEIHARLALEVGDLAEYNQCQSQLKTLYTEGIEGCHMEFTAYGLLSVILHSHNVRDLLSLMSRLSSDAKQNAAVRHALAVRRAVTSENYVMFFRLYKTAPNLNSCIMDQYADKMRYRAVTCICKSHRPTVPVSYIAQILGFAHTMAATDENDEKESDGLEECAAWLKAHGACLISDNSGEAQLDSKASATTLYVPEPEDAVAHGDASLAVDDFLTSAPS